MWELNPPASPPLDSHQIPRKKIVLEELLGRVRHTITSNLLEVSVHAARLERGATLAGSRWVLPRDMGRLPLTTITRKALSSGQ